MASRGLVLPAGSLADAQATARRAESAGLAAAWSGEFVDRSGFMTVAAMSAVTTRMRVGTSIAHAFGRSPLVLANDARFLDEFTGGRLVLGLGTGTPQMMADWHGLADTSGPALRLEELVPLVRRLWRLCEGPVRHRGRFYSLEVIPNDEVTAPLRPDLPIYTAAAGRRMIEVAGRVADGVLCHPTLTRRYLDEVARPAVERGAAKVGRSVRDVAMCGQIICAISDDVDRARREAATQLTFYVLHAAYGAVMEASGFGKEAAEVREAFRVGDHARMVAAVSDEMIDEMSAAGTPADVRHAVRRLEASFDHVSFCPPSFTVDRGRVRENVDAILETLGPSNDRAA